MSEYVATNFGSSSRSLNLSSKYWLFKMIFAVQILLNQQGFCERDVLQIYVRMKTNADAIAILVHSIKFQIRLLMSDILIVSRKKHEFVNINIETLLGHL